MKKRNFSRTILASLALLIALLVNFFASPIPRAKKGDKEPMYATPVNYAYVASNMRINGKVDDLSNYRKAVRSSRQVSDKKVIVSDNRSLI